MFKDISDGYTVQKPDSQNRIDPPEVNTGNTHIPGSNHPPLPENSLKPIERSIFPMLFIDKKLKIIYSNRACEKLFRGFFRLSGNYFMDLFGHSMEIQDLRKIRQTILTGINGHSWNGEVNAKSRNLGTIKAKLYIFPADPANPHPEIFIAMFDDFTEKSKNLSQSVFLSLLEASKLKDNDTGKHILRVSLYAKRLAQKIHSSMKPIYQRIDADYIDNIGFLASMHDVGKIGTPDDILNKDGSLSEWEWKIMREHTINGGYILSTYPHPMAKDIALCHHEQWNGTGYPYKLEGEMIPLAARIVAIVDVYDALRMKRSYKPGYNHNASTEIIMDESGTHFDPSLLKFFYAIASDFNDIYDANRD